MIKRISHQLLTLTKLFIFCLLIGICHNAEVLAQGATGQCYINTAGDYICPLGGADGGDPTGNPFLDDDGGLNPVAGGSPLVTGLNDIPGVSNAQGAINGLLACLSQPMQNAMMLQLTQLVGTNATSGDYNNIINQFQDACNMMDQIASGGFCGSGGGGPNFMSYAQNSLGAQTALFGAGDLGSVIGGLCGGAGGGGLGLPGFGIGDIGGGGGGGGGGTYQQCSDGGPNLGPPEGATPGERIANSARRMEGYSTSCVPGTDKGNLACAWVVSEILKGAGYPLQGGGTLSTVTLREKLANDPCYTIVDTGTLTAADAANLQEGDILVTPTNFDTSGASGTCRSNYSGRCNSGHTGVYTGSGGIVSNGSEGTHGPGAGVSENYNVTSWKSITDRNTAQSAVFRRTCP